MTKSSQFFKNLINKNISIQSTLLQDNQKLNSLDPRVKSGKQTSIKSLIIIIDKILFIALTLTILYLMIF